MKVRVYLTETVTQTFSATVEVDAADPEDAVDKAKAMVCESGRGLFEGYPRHPDDEESLDAAYEFFPE